MKNSKNKRYFDNRKKRKDNLSGYLFLAPTIIMFLCFILLPIVLSFVLSFFKYNLIGAPEFVGVANIKKIFRDKGVLNSFGNTFKFLLILVPVHCILGVILAFLVYRAKRFKFFFRTAIYFPAVVTTASVAIAWGYMFATDTGVINFFIRLSGGSAIPWLTNRTIVYITIALFSFWKFVGITFLYYFTGLQNIPDVYYEAAQIDGSSTGHTFLHVTIPLLTPTIFFVVITNIVGVFQIFDEPFLLTAGGPGMATKTVALEIYQTAFKEMNIGYGAMISFVLFLVILVITVVQYVGQNKWVVYDYE